MSATSRGTSHRPQNIEGSTARFHTADIIIRDDLSFLVAVVTKAAWEATMRMMRLCTD